MRLTIDGIPATLDLPPGYRVADVVLVARVTSDTDPKDDHVTLGTTDHTGNLIVDMLLEVAPFATDHAHADDD